MSAARLEAWAWLLQRACAAFLAAAVLVHLGTILWAVQQGLSARAILSRTVGNEAWLAFYAAFAVTAAVHGAHGLRTVLREWTLWRGRSVDIAALAVALLLAFGGCRAAWALYAG